MTSLTSYPVYPRPPFCVLPIVENVLPILFGTFLGVSSSHFRAMRGVVHASDVLLRFLRFALTSRRRVLQEGVQVSNSSLAPAASRLPPHCAMDK